MLADATRIYPEIHQLLKERDAAHERLTTARAELRTAMTLGCAEHETLRTASIAKNKALLASAEVENALRVAKDKACKEFAASRGWIYSTTRRPFTLERLRGEPCRGSAWSRPDYGLGRELDHPNYFWHGRRAIGIVAHNYAPWEECLAFAEAKRLHAELLPSWYYPAGAIAVLYTRKAP